jgi:deoxyribonuclease-4
MGRIRFGPSGLRTDVEPEAAVAEVAGAGFDACEVGFVGGFKLDYPLVERLGEAARAHDVALSVHAPLAGFMGHLDLGKKYRMAVGMLDHTAGLAVACGAEVVVFHPGFLLGREREQALDDVVEQLGLLGERLEAKGRLVPFGVEVMGRVRELGSLEDVVELAARVPFVRPVLDFAHLHATSDGAYTDAEPFAAALEAADGVLEPGAPFHVHFSDIAYANRNETKHLPYGEGTLRAEPLGAALARFERPAIVISEAPDEASTQAIGAALRAGASSASRSS